MKRLCLPVLACLSLMCITSIAQVGGKPPKYLFLINSSTAFSEYGGTVRNLMYDLIENGLQGRMKDGEAFTIWTFNDDVDTMSYPVVEWTAAMKVEEANRAFEYLRLKPYAGGRNWREALVAGFSAIKGVPEITVIIVSDGFNRMEGTAYDERINQVYADFGASFQSEGKPFITTLVGRDGKVVGAAVNTVGEELVDPTPKGIKHPVKPAVEKESPTIPKVVKPIQKAQIPLVEEGASIESSGESVESEATNGPSAESAKIAAATDSLAGPVDELEPVVDVAESVPSAVDDLAETVGIALTASTLKEDPVAEATTDTGAGKIEPVATQKTSEIASKKVLEPADVNPVKTVPESTPAPSQNTPVTVAAVSSTVLEKNELLTPVSAKNEVLDEVPPAAQSEEGLMAGKLKRDSVAETRDDTRAQPILANSGVSSATTPRSRARIYYGLAGGSVLVGAVLLGIWMMKPKPRRESSFITQSINRR